MPYLLAPGGNAMAIAEQQYAGAGTIRFTPFTSCIGVMGYNAGVVTGVHLVMFAQDDTPFNNAAANATVAAIGAYARVCVIGQTQMWADNLTAPYNYLLGLLLNPVVIDMNDGTYGGRVVNGICQVYLNGNYVPL
jgi:hypothetical protein